MCNFFLGSNNDSTWLGVTALVYLLTHSKTVYNLVMLVWGWLH